MRNEATFRFYAELNDFLPPEMGQRPTSHPIYERQSVKHLIESLGVPHTEAELILANGKAVDFDYMVQPGDHIAVYPHFTGLPVDATARLRPPPPSPPRYPDGNHNDEDLAQMAAAENRILLTRDRGLLKRSVVVYGYCLRTRNSKAQLKAVLHRYGLFAQIRPWQRCLKCNGRLHPIAKEQIIHRLEPKTKKYFNDFHICEDCDRVYWKGSHYQRMAKLVEEIRNHNAVGRKP